jgi:hypothetical protein
MPNCANGEKNQRKKWSSPEIQEIIRAIGSIPGDGIVGDCIRASEKLIRCNQHGKQYQSAKEKNYDCRGFFRCPKHKIKQIAKIYFLRKYGCDLAMPNESQVNNKLFLPVIFIFLSRD